MSPKNYQDPRFRPTTLVELLRWRAETRPNTRAFTFLVDGRKKEVQLTYAELDKKVRAFATLLQKKGLKGERALLLFPPGIDYIIAFFGCLYAGVIAVPAYPPDPNRLNRTLPRLQAIVHDAQASMALTNDSIMYMIKILRLGNKFTDTMERMPLLRKFRTTMNYFTAQKTGLANARELGELQWISSDDVLDSLADSWHEPDINESTIAFLQYTSGSTGTPKGVMLTHGNLLANSADIYTAFGYREGTEGVIWLPIYHDMGLIGGVMQPIYGGMSTTLLSPIHFLQKPMRWLETISRIKSVNVVSGGPNFAYDLCVKKVTQKHLETLDLSNWSVAFSGAEPVRYETVERFYNTFKDNGFKKEAFLSCYGLAEASLYVTGVDYKEIPPSMHFDKLELGKSKLISVSGSHPNAQHMISCGHPPLDQRVEIVNPQTFKIAEPDETGEIWVQGPNISQGYWNRKQATEETFGARISGSNDGPFLRTGDLGAMVDGELYITGRVKDLIIIRGRNYYPQDLEFVVENVHQAIRPGCSAAFSIEEDEQEKLVIVAEVRQQKNLPLEEITAMIRAAVSETNDIRVQTIVLIKARTISKTSSGKIQRHAVKNEFFEDKLKIIHRWDGSKSISEAAIIDEMDARQQPMEEKASPSTEISPVTKKGDLTLEIEAWLVMHLAETLEVDSDEIDVNKQFVTYGMDSAQAIGLVGDLEDYVQRPLSPTIIWDYPNISALAEYIGSDGGEAPVLLRKKQSTHEDEPIAIIGYSLRMPKAKTADEFWDNLRNGVDCISEVPETRWDIDKFYSAEPGTPAKMITRYGGFLDDVDQFDPQFFGISPREAPHMDPQQRLLLEVSYEAFENAGYNLQTLSGTETGVYIGISGADYLRLQVGDFERLNAYSGTGNAFCIAANRISYAYNLKGPSFSMDTACSSSLVAIHNAVTSLRKGECEMACAGGVNLVLAPDVTITFSQARMMSPDGRCRTFDAGANGYVRGDGVGVIILKRLEDALKDGDPVRAIIRGSAVNQDGKSNGITAPNGIAQQQCIREALSDAHVKASDVSYVETHGTGTPLGDPIETEAMKAAMMEGRSDEDDLFIGSVKTNIGHLESAAGISGILKTVLALEHETIPKHLHFTKLNPHIHLENTPIKIASETMHWSRNGKPRIAGVSAYGFGGTNAHVILQESMDSLDNQVERDYSNINGPYALALSAHTEKAVADMARSYAKALSAKKYQVKENFIDFIYSANVHRGQFDHSSVVIATDRDDLLKKLNNFETTETVPGIIKGSSQINAQNKTLFVYSGQGPQWFAMGRQLLEKEPVFKRAIQQINDLLSEYAGWSLIEELSRDEENTRVGETEIAQPAIFAIQVALTRLWASWGVKPAAVVGHSVGEVAAAYVSGTLSLKDAVKVIYHRGRLMQRATGFGKMASVDLSIEKAREAIKGYEGKLGVGAHNSPQNTVLSGDANALREVLDKLDKQGIYTKMLRVNYAFHSPNMDAYKQELIDSLQGIQIHSAVIPIYSTLSGKRSVETEYDPIYWSNNIREKVSFSEAMDSVLKDGYSIFVEIAPHPVLGGSIRQCAGQVKKEATIVASLKRNADEHETIYAALSALYCNGIPINWKALFPANAHFTPLPNYPWQHERYWFELKGNDPNNAPIFKNPASAFSGGHPLLGKERKEPLAPAKTVFSTTIDLDRLNYLKDHVVQDSVVFPAAAYIEMAMSSIHASDDEMVKIADINFFKALFLNSDKDMPIELIRTAYTSVASSLQIFSLETDQGQGQRWVMNAMGSAVKEKTQTPVLDMEALRKSCSTQIETGEFYNQLHEKGLQYGPNFQGVHEIYQGDHQAFSRLEIDKNLLKQSSEYRIHPALLDAALQTLSATFSTKELDSDNATFLPVGIGNIWSYKKATSSAMCHVRLTSEIGPAARYITGDLALFDDEGALLARIEGLKLQKLGYQEEEDLSDWYYTVEWPQQALEDVEEHPQLEAADYWLVFADKHSSGAKIGEGFNMAGGTVFYARPADNFTRIDEYIYGINPENKADFKALFDQIGQVNNGNLKGVIYLWALEAVENNQLEANNIYNATQKILTPALYLMQALVENVFKHRPKVAFITRYGRTCLKSDPELSAIQSALWGLARVYSTENPAWHILKIDFDSFDSAPSLLIQELTANHGEEQICYRDEVRHVARIERAREDYTLKDSEAEVSDGGLQIPDGPFNLQITSPGVLSALSYQAAQRIEPGKGQIEIDVNATGLNFRDVLMALGLYPGAPIPLGSECSGTVSKVGEGVTDFKPGDAVLAIAPNTFGKYAVTLSDLAAHKPENITFEEAATLPITYLTAYYAMVYLGRLQPGERILIHAGAGGVGQAAIRIAQMIGADIYTTAGSEHKHQFLRDMGVKHIMSSRNLDFADQIMQETQGEGVDMVLNSLAGEFIPRSITLLKPYGRFLEIGKTDIFQNSQIDMYPFRNNLSFHAIDLDMVSRDRPQIIHELFRQLMQLFSEGKLQALPKTTFEASDTVKAFRYMAQRKNIGKIVVKIKPDGTESDTGSRLFNEEGVYLITGGLGSIGIRLASWMAAKGAGHLVLLGRSAPNDFALKIIDDLKKKNIKVDIHATDVADYDALKRVIKQYPKLKGVVHAAGVLKDMPTIKLESDSLMQPLAPKAIGVYNLHKLTEKLDIDLFLTFSSVAATIGNPGQGNYAAANIFMDALMAIRYKRGLPATNINWGFWDTDGMAKSSQAISIPGVGFIDIQKGFFILERILLNKSPHMLITSVKWPDYLEPYPENKIPPIYWSFADQKRKATGNATSAGGAITAEALLALPPDEQMEKMNRYLQVKIAKVLGVRVAKLDVDKPLNSMGLDSLMAIELKNSVETGLGTNLAISVLLKGPSILDLSQEMISQILDDVDSVEEDNVEIDESEFPVTHGQRAMWFQHLLSPSSIYNQVYAVKLKKPINVDLLRRSLYALSMRHQALRTNFMAVESKPQQIVHDEPRQLLHEIDTRDLSDAQFKTILNREIKRPFDLENDTLTRVILFDRPDDSQVFLYIGHHITSDMWSLAIFMDELNKIYLADGVDNLDPIPMTFAEYARAANQMLAGRQGRRHLEYWKNVLSGELPILNLQTDKPRPAIQTYNGLTITDNIDPKTTARLTEIAKKHGTTLYALLIAIYKMMLYHYTGQEDIIIGTPTTGRTKPEYAPLIGYFVNPVAIRSQVNGMERFDQFLEKMRDIVLDALEHQDYPFNLLVEKLHPKRDPSRTPVFQNMFVYQKAYLLHESGMSGLAVAEDGGKMTLGEVELESIAIEDRIVPFDVTMLMAEVGDGLGISLQYNTNLFEDATAKKMIRSFKNLIIAVSGDPLRKIADYSLLEKDERKNLLHNWNATDRIYHSIVPVHRLFEQQVIKAEDKTALILNDTSLSYGQLNEQANCVANTLINAGIGADDIVGIMADRSFEMIVAIFGILKTGAAYLPLDSGYPSARLDFMLTDAGVKTLLTQKGLEGKLSQNNIPVHYIDEMISEGNSKQPAVKIDKSNLAYIIYTSGSTGRPKGVMISHGNLFNLIHAQIKLFGIKPETRLLQFASVSFDAAASEIFTTLSSAATLCLVDKETLLDGSKLVDYIRTQDISTSTIPPSVLRVIMPENLNKLTTVISAGEAVRPEIVNIWQESNPKRKMINAYGPTEATICASAYTMTGIPEGDQIPIGKAIDNVRIYVLDKYMNPVAIGVPGELHIGGQGVARGYLNRPGLTAEKFVPDPFSGHAGERLYRSGDLVVYRKDGNLVFLDRIDSQVKIRGFRIELGEIENKIKENTQIRDCHVAAFGKTDKKLAAYIIGEDGLDMDGLKFNLHKSLPDYMVPSVIIVLDELPLTANGKIDTAALPSPEGTRAKFVKAQSEIEIKLTEIWEEILGADPIGINDNFFDLGGHSLNIVQAQGKIKDILGVELNVVDMFRYPTISSFALFIENGDNGEERSRKSEERATKAREATRVTQQRLKSRRRR